VSFVLAFDDIEGFRDIKWGDSVAKLGNYTIIKETPDTKEMIAIKNDEYLKIGEANISYITYHFFDDKLIWVTIRYVSKEDNNIIIQTLESKYGEFKDIGGLSPECDKNYKYHIKCKTSFVSGDVRINTHYDFYTTDKEKGRIEITNLKLLKPAGEYANKINAQKEAIKKQKIQEGVKDL
jgi:hypothetical protein